MGCKTACRWTPRASRFALVGLLLFASCGGERSGVGLGLDAGLPDVSDTSVLDRREAGTWGDLDTEHGDHGNSDCAAPTADMDGASRQADADGGLLDGEADTLPEPRHESPSLSFSLLMENGKAGAGALIALQDDVLLSSLPPCAAALSREDLDALREAARPQYWQSITPITCSESLIGHRLSLTVRAEDGATTSVHTTFCENPEWPRVPSSLLAFAAEVERIATARCGGSLDLFLDPDAPPTVSREDLLELSVTVDGATLAGALLAIEHMTIRFGGELPYRPLAVSEAAYDNLLERTRSAELDGARLDRGEWCFAGAPQYSGTIRYYNEEGVRADRPFRFCLVEPPGRVPADLVALLILVRTQIRLGLAWRPVTVLPAESADLFFDQDGVGRSRAPIEFVLDWHPGFTAERPRQYGLLGGYFWDGYECLEPISETTEAELRGLAAAVPWDELVASTSQCPSDAPKYGLAVRFNDVEGGFEERELDVCSVAQGGSPLELIEFLQAIERTRYRLCAGSAGLLLLPETSRD